MTRRNITVGIDIGTHQTKVVVSEKVRGNDRFLPRIIGTGRAESRGIRHGYVMNARDAQKSLRTALKQAERSASVDISRAFLSIGGVGLGSVTSTGKTAITRADMEVSESDIQAAHEACENEIPASHSLNRSIVHSIPLEYTLDGHGVLGSPLGLKGSSLEVKTLFVTCLEHHLNDLIEVVESAGVEVIEIVAAPIAASFVSLTKAQKIAGCVLTNIGADTLSLAVFENNIPISLEVISIGGSDITNDIALGFKIPLEEAEQIKLGGVTGTQVSKRQLDEIISARLSDIFELITAHLKKIGRNELLPAGIVITGGGSGISDIKERARANLKLPSSVASLASIGGKDSPLRDSTWSVAYGLCIIGINKDTGGDLGVHTFLQKTKNGFFTWIKQFLP